MTNRIHLDGLIAATKQPLHLRLLESFREAARDPDFTEADYAARLRSVMEDALVPEATDAPSQSPDQ
jgi:hypothetical protein